MKSLRWAWLSHLFYPDNLKFNRKPIAWRITMGAVFAQFVTPFEIKDAALGGYEAVAYMRMPRDKRYAEPSPERKSRGWIVLRSAGGVELFRADVNLFMDGGVGVMVSDAGKLADALIKSSGALLEPEHAVKVLDAVLGRLEAMHSPWASMAFDSARGLECFHEDVDAKRTDKKFVVDLRLHRRGTATSYYSSSNY